MLNFIQNIIKGVVEFMKKLANLTVEELESNIAHYEQRLIDLFITEDQINFIKEMLKELKNIKETKESYTF